jgi:hypothetical protein
MAKKTIKTVEIATGNCRVGSNYDDEEREKLKNIIRLYCKKLL